MSLGTEASCCLVLGTSSNTAWMSLVLEKMLTSVPINAVWNLSPDAKNGIFHDYMQLEKTDVFAYGSEYENI